MASLSSEKIGKIFQKEHFKKIETLADSILSVDAILNKQPKEISIYYSEFPYDAFGCCIDHFKQVKDSAIDIIVGNTINDETRKLIDDINNNYKTNIKLWHDKNYMPKFSFITGDGLYLKVEESNSLLLNNRWWHYTFKEHYDEETITLIKEESIKFKTILNSAARII